MRPTTNLPMLRSAIPMAPTAGRRWSSWNSLKPRIDPRHGARTHPCLTPVWTISTRRRARMARAAKPSGIESTGAGGRHGLLARTRQQPGHPLATAPDRSAPPFNLPCKVKRRDSPPRAANHVHDLRDPAQGRAHRGDLRHDVDAITVARHHARETAHLALDAPETLERRCLDLIAHAVHIPPRGTGFKGAPAGRGEGAGRCARSSSTEGITGIATRAPNTRAPWTRCAG